MRHYAGLDVSVKETSVCIVDESGKVCRETKVPSHPATEHLTGKGIYSLFIIKIGESLP